MRACGFFCLVSRVSTQGRVESIRSKQKAKGNRFNDVDKRGEEISTSLNVSDHALALETHQQQQPSVKNIDSQLRELSAHDHRELDPSCMMIADGKAGWCS